MEFLGVTNLFIEDIVSCAKLRNYRGCFSSDRIPPSLTREKKWSIICNLSRSADEGTHFVALIREDQELYYFDPLQLDEHPNQDIASFLRSCSGVEKLYQLTEPLQDEESFYCGFFCIFIVIFAERRDTPVLTFSKIHLTDNDSIVVENIARLLTA